MADDDAQITGGSLLEINTMIKGRMEAKMARAFDHADELLSRLEQEYGVRVDDGKKRWRADGKSFERQYERVGEAGEVDEVAVAELIRERTAARRERDYARADDLLEELLASYGVVLVDAEHTWRLVGSAHDGRYGEGGGYGRRADDAGGTHDYDPLYADDMRHAQAQGTAEAIDALIAERLAHKKARRFDEADLLQERLRSEHGVLVDDRERTWTIAYGGGDGGGDIGGIAEDDEVEDGDDGVAAVAEIETELAVEHAEPAVETEPAVEVEPTGETEAELTKLTVPLLKDKCRGRGLKVGGTKKELIARLLSEGEP